MLFLDAFPPPPPPFLSKPVAQYWNCTFLEPVWKSHAEILSCSPLLLCLYCPELENDLHKRISLKEKKCSKDIYQDDEEENVMERV